MNVLGGPFPDVARVDAHDKVCGATRYAADQSTPSMLHAMFAVATIGRGQMVTLDVQAARATPGVRLVLTHVELASQLTSAGFIALGGLAFQSFQPMTATAIAYRGQPIALIVGETLEAVIEAVSSVKATYVSEPLGVTLDAPTAEVVGQAEAMQPRARFDDLRAGDADGAFASAQVQIDASFECAPHHHNPMELIGTIAEWRGETLVIHEGTQNAESVRQGLARQLSLPADRIEVLSPSVGGAFGQKSCLQMQTGFAALAARQLGRPVKIVTPRAQLFTDTCFRPASRHRIRLGASRDGDMQALIHEVDFQTSRHDLFPGFYTDLSPRLHNIPNFRGRQRLVRTDVATPGNVRAPYEHPTAFALESAVDELAYAIDLDPVALRLRNDTTTDPITGKPLTSRHLVECLTRGAERFGWARRTMAPGSMADRDGTLVGWGVAAGGYKASTAPAIARLRCTADGGVSVGVGGHEMGQGIRTAIALALARRLRVPMSDIRIHIGDTRAAPQHLTAGSWGTATTIPAVEQAADEMLKALAALGTSGTADRSPAQILRAARRDDLVVEIARMAPGQPVDALDRVRAGLVASVGPVYAEFVSLSYVAHFVEVRIEPTTRRVRVPRVVSVVDCGRVVSPRTARSQMIGGVVWGLSVALREGSEVDPRYGGFLNADFADYVIPVHADIGEIDIDFIDKPDPLLNETGVKGLGEVAMVGVAAAVANAIHHATGQRLRQLPIRLDHLV